MSARHESTAPGPPTPATASVTTSQGPEFVYPFVAAVAGTAFVIAGIVVLIVTALATAIAEESAPLAVRADLASAHRSRDEGDRSAAAYLLPDATALFATADGAEGIQSFIDRHKPRFTGH
jgi:enoyl-CoA hydratase/carnithine racemase